MKKGIPFKYLISASMLLVLASCDNVPGGASVPAPISGESVTSLDSSADVSIGLSSDVGGSGSDPVASSTTKPDYNTSVLQNAISTSLSKNGMRMVQNNPSIQLGLSTYTVLGTAPNFNLKKGSINNIILQADSETVEYTKSASLGITGMHSNVNNLSLVMGALALAGSNFPAQNLINQDANLYYKDGTFYWDFLDENGEPCTGLSSLADLGFEALASALGASNEIEFQHKGKYELDAQMQMYMLLISAYLPSLLPDYVDSMIQSLWQGGAEITTTKTGDLYDMAITTNDPSIVLGSTSDLTSSAGTGSLVGGLTDELPVDVGSVTDGLGEDYFSTFEYELHFGYTINSLKSMSMTLEATTDETKVKEDILKDADLKAGDTELGLESISMSQTTDFTFDNNITIAFPSFDDYAVQEIPELPKNEEGDTNIIPTSEPSSSRPPVKPTSSKGR